MKSEILAAIAMAALATPSAAKTLTTIEYYDVTNWTYIEYVFTPDLISSFDLYETGECDEESGCARPVQPSEMPTARVILNIRGKDTNPLGGRTVNSWDVCDTDEEPRGCRIAPRSGLFGYIDVYLDSYMQTGSFSLTFDSIGNITAWEMSFFQPYEDTIEYSSVNFGSWTDEVLETNDYYAIWQAKTSGPGDWSTLPVPLPAAGFLLVGAIGALSLLRRKTI